MRPAKITCQHCGAAMKWCLGPNPRCQVDTYFAQCPRTDLPSERDVPGSIYPQRCGNVCYENVPVDTVKAAEKEKARQEAGQCVMDHCFSFQLINLTK